LVIHSMGKHCVIHPPNNKRTKKIRNKGKQIIIHTHPKP